jgi:hypothetical protein
LATAFPPAAHQFANFINGFRDEGIAVRLEALEVFRQSHLEPQDFQREIRLIQQRLSLTSVPGSDERFQQIIEVAFDPFAEDKPMIPWEAAGVAARPQKEVVSLGDDE